ncbi:MAG: hypothetical protein E6I82_02360, partial [Chloroflexi bacterium]
NLLFERFLHEEMTSTPDIDIDFSTAHREQVIQYIYEKYGWERTGMVCNVVTFQPRMAIRQVGKALGFSAELLDRLAKGVDRWFTEDVEDSMLSSVPPPDMRPQSWQHFLELCREVIEFPRHLSIHNGGMLVTGEPLVDIAPVEPAAMEGRRVVQFNKDDVEDLGLIKMDMLGLRTLSVVAEALELIKDTTGTRPDLDQLALKDAAVFEMCSQADTIGVFQIESRAGRGGDHPAWTDPGQRRPSLHPPQAGTGAGHVRASAARADPQGHARCDPLSGTDHRDRDVRRRHEAGTGGWLSPRHDPPSQSRRDVIPRGRVHQRLPRERSAARGGGPAVRRGAGLRRLRLLPLTRGRLRPDRLRDRMDEAASPGRVRLRAAQQPADGFLPPERAGRGPEAARHEGAPGRHQSLGRPLPA